MRWPVIAAFFCGYLFLDWVSYIHPVQQSAITPWNPHPALAVALLTLAGQRWLPAVALAIFGSEVVVRHMPAGFPVTVLVSIVLALGYGAISAALRNVLFPGAVIDSPRRLTRFIGVIMVGTLVTGTLYVGALLASGARLPAPYFEALAQFWIGDSVGILVTLPVILLFRDPARRAEAVAAIRHPVAWLQLASIAAALGLAFGPVVADPFRFFYILFMPLVWIGMRFGLLGAATATLGIQCGVIAAAQLSGSAALTVFELQALLIALAITGLFLGVSVDERKRAASGLRESLRMAAAGEMSAALAHELNQPLAALLAYAKAAALMAENERTDRAALLDTLGKAQREAARAAEVVARLRDFFRTGATHLENASLPAIATAVVDSLAPRARTFGIQLSQQADPATPPVLIDPLQIEVVLRNLVANGVEAARTASEPKSVLVTIASDGHGFVRASVRDSGPGVPAEAADRIFEPFWTSRSSGMGMGLAISRAIVEAHGGRLWFDGSKGSSFAFTIPTSPHPT